jgi:hypothetical protein
MLWIDSLLRCLMALAGANHAAELCQRRHCACSMLGMRSSTLAWSASSTPRFPVSRWRDWRKGIFEFGDRSGSERKSVRV